MSAKNRTKSCREFPKNHLTASPSKPSGWLPKPRVAGSSPVYRSNHKSSHKGCTNQCTLFFCSNHKYMKNHNEK